MGRRLFILTLMVAALLIPGAIYADVAAFPEPYNIGKILTIAVVIVIALTIIITVGMYINKRKK